VRRANSEHDCEWERRKHRPFGCQIRFGHRWYLTRENAFRFKPYPDDLTKNGAPGESRVPLQDDNIYWVGQHLGVLVAETFEQATHAASLVRVQYESKPPLVSLAETSLWETSTFEHENKPWSNKKLRECYQRGAEKFGWSKRSRKPGATRAADGSQIGFGMATAIYPAGQQKVGATAILNRDGTVTVRSATHEIGTGTYTAMSQFAADTLGIPIEKVRFELGDSQFADAPNNGGSWLTSSVAPAVMGACRELKKKVAEAGGNWPNDPAQLANLFARFGQEQVQAEFNSEPNREEREKFSFFSYVALFVEVHIDLLGQARVKRAVGVYDTGRMINPRLARSQIIGGMLFGFSMALMEGTIPDEKTGRIVNPNLADYHVAVHADTPEFDIDFINEADPHMPDLGARGIGEIGIVGAPAAVANAIFNATGKRVRDLPITPDKLI
jgi:xanthine dehydrogenase YagR molybdenum-binding subunit